MAQYYEVLSQSEKSTEQQFYNNVEDQTVQYVITPEKTQRQYPTQQIVVTSGDQLMLVDGQQPQIVIDQSSITYQGQQVQQAQVQQQIQAPQPQIQVQTQQYAVIQDGSLNNGSQQIFFMEGSPSDRVVVEQPVVQQVQLQQPIVLNHQLSQSNSIARSTPAKAAQVQLPQQVRATLRQPLMQQQNRPINRQLQRMANTNQPVRQLNPNQQAQLRQPTPGQPQLRHPNSNLAQLRQPNPQQLKQQGPNQLSRPATPNQPQFRAQNPNQSQIRQQSNLQQQARQANPAPQQQVRQPNPGTQQKTHNPQMQKNPTTLNSRFQNLPQLQQKINNNQPVDMEDTDIKSSDEQEPVSLPDGSVVSVAVYKKMIAEQKSRALQQRTNTQPTSVANQPAISSSSPKKRTATPRNTSRQPSRASSAGRAGRGRNSNQFQSPQQQPQPQTQPQQPQTRPQQPNDPSRYAMMTQQPQAQVNKQPPQYQNQMQNQLMQQQRQAQARQSQANYVIQPPKANQRPQQQRPLPSYIPSSQIQKIIESTPISEEFSDSIRMLVLLENGEQRLITFTLPKEACTIQEILEQVNVPFQSSTNIQVTEANTNGINYIVTVGNVPNFDYDEEESQTQEESPPPVSSAPPMVAQQQMAPSPSAVAQMNEPPKAASPVSPELPKEIPKFIPGMLALCAACGYLSEDFAKCIRCLRKLPDSVKAIPATIRTSSGQKKELMIAQQPKTNSSPPKPTTPTKKKPSKSSKVIEHESVVISSDEEEEEKPSRVAENILQKLGASVTICPVTKEPSPNDIQRHSSSKSRGPNLDQEEIKFISTEIKCRTIRIGSYRCIPQEKVLIDLEQVIMKVPHPVRETEIKTIKIDRCDIVKVLASFNKTLPVYFYYLNPALAKIIREDLDMTPDGDFYYDPLSSKEEAYRRITLLPEDVSEEDREAFQIIYGCTPSILDELNVKEANDILIKTCPKELTKAALGIGSFTEIKQLLTYPPEGRGRISINTEDYVCLAQDQFLNDVIIDFYLKYLVENLPEEQKPKVHIFSTFFYKRLTTKPTKASRKSQPAELDPTLTPAQKRHARVRTWTKNVNIFDKDFIIVPINENAHWFLAIVCFPGMDGCQTWDGKPYKLEPSSRKKKKLTIATNIGNVTVSTVKQEPPEKPIVCEDPEMSDKDEAEGDDSELDSDDSEELPPPQAPITLISTPSSSPIALTSPTKQTKEPRAQIKQPCILIFDSLAGASRSRVVATLRDYLTCEYKVKLGKEKVYNKDVIKGASPKVPQQNNFTDCGLYLLQYVEQFFKDPIKDYHIPISQIKNWFEEITVTKKREDIANLIKNLMEQYGKDIRMLPEISFPTLNGKLLEREFEDEEEEMMDEEDSAMQEDYKEKDESHTSLESAMDTSSNPEDGKNDEAPSPMKPSSDSVTNDFVAQPVINPKPDLSEFPRQTNRDTLSYLKAKRIIRHKNSEGPDVKKLRGDQ